MKIKGLLYLLIIPTIVVGLSSWYSSGSPGGKTGSPGDGSNCTACHTGTPQSASSWITTNIPASGYTPGETYTITATGTHSGVNKFGFETTAEALGGAKKGTFIITDAAQTKFTNSNKAVTHTSGGTTPSGDSKSWSFDWTAPAAGTGNVTFFGAFNAANGNGNTGGDVIYLSSTTVSEEEMEPETSLTIAFSGMTPHIGKLLEIRLVNKYDKMEYARKVVDPIPSADFDVVFENIVDGDSYFVDFYADHNDNGMYDAPPADHAWRLDADNVQGGDVIPFAHNTDFTDIDWKHMLTVDFSGMTPHMGQLLEISLRDITYSYEEVYRSRVDGIASADFTVEMPALTPGHTYNVDFYADFNGNGIYDDPPADHAWRMKTSNVSGDETLSFTHNTDFTNIGWDYLLTLDLMSMVPHQGQMLMVRAVNTETGKEVSRMKRGVDLVDISLSLPGLEMGETYDIDFFADHNGNGIYDPPPTDHSWRLTTTAVAGNTDLSFTHNANFVDIDWRYMTTLHAQEMDPHIGQLFELRVYNFETLEETGLVSIAALELTDFYVKVPGAEIGESYNMDFYADFNGSGDYDSPPTDHAWRINLETLEGDSVVPFTHNTDFTDILWPVNVFENRPKTTKVNAYPNPFSDALYVPISAEGKSAVELFVYAVDGRLVNSYRHFGTAKDYPLNTSELKTGLYHIVILYDDNSRHYSTVIKK